LLDSDPRYPNLKILNLSHEADAKRLLFLLSGVYESDDKGFLQNHQPGLRLPAGMIAHLVLPHNARSLGAQAAIIESDYVDRDTNIAYAQLYARAFRDYPRRTLRLHFLRREITSYDEFLDEKSLQKSYIGYCVLSPNTRGGIGRTVLPPPKGDKEWLFVPTQSEFSINVGGAQLKAKGTAFVQQDGRVAACASAATWMSTVISARQFDFDMLVRSMAEITALATKYSLPPSGRGSTPGLTVEQILWALQEMNYEPLSYEVGDTNSATELLYTFVESGIPPILIIYLPGRGLHAVTAVGHTYDANFDCRAEIAGDTYSLNVSTWCPYFVVHDDQKGPYIKIKLGPLKLGPKKEERPSLMVDDADPLLGPFREEIVKWYSDAVLCYVVAPFPPRHILRPEDAVIKAIAILMRAYNLYAERLSLQFPKPFIMRTYFTGSNVFKRRFRAFNGLSSELSHWYRGSVYPRYIWVTEFCGLEHKNLKLPDQLKIIADITIDPTASPHSLDFVTLHMPHLFFRMFPGDGDVNKALRFPVAFIQNDQPYQPLVRIEMGRPPMILSP
jgi:hypothetical protein